MFNQNKTKTVEMKEYIQIRGMFSYTGKTLTYSEKEELEGYMYTYICIYTYIYHERKFLYMIIFSDQVD